MGCAGEGWTAVVRRKEGQLAEPSGQGLLDFPDESTPVLAVDPQTAEEWFQCARDFEQAG
jgi:hypothetical protein